VNWKENERKLVSQHSSRCTEESHGVKIQNCWTPVRIRATYLLKLSLSAKLLGDKEMKQW